MKKIIAFSLALLLIGCTTVPITGRRQLKFMPDSELLAMSFNQYSSFLSQNQMSTDMQQTATIRRVGNRIQQAVEQYMTENNMLNRISSFRWEFNLVDSKEVNAWCMPGGKVVVYTGILPICENETGLAVVMGHEIAHAIAEHGNERMSQGLFANGLLVAGQVVLNSSQHRSTANQLLLQAAGVGTQLGLLSFSRSHESEADRIGIIFSSMAGYDPREAPKFWQRMSAGAGGQQVPQFLSTHPSPETRIRDLNALVVDAMKYYENSKFKN